jgi:hypothetical protein
MAIRDLPKLDSTHLVYKGHFGVPVGRWSADQVSLQYGGIGLAFNPLSQAPNGSLFFLCATGLAGNNGVVEIAIPAPNLWTYSPNRLNLNRPAGLIQAGRNIFGGRSIDASWNTTDYTITYDQLGRKIFNFGPAFQSPAFDDAVFGSNTLASGLLLDGDDLYVSLTTNYDSGIGRISHFRMIGGRTNLAGCQCSKPWLVKMPNNTVWTTSQTANHHAGHTGGYIHHVPAAWRAELGGAGSKHWVGGCDKNVAARNSIIPPAFCGDLTSFDSVNPIDAPFVRARWGGSDHSGSSCPNPGTDPFLTGPTIAWGFGPGHPQRWYSPKLRNRGFLPIPGTRTALNWKCGAGQVGYVCYGYGMAVAPFDAEGNPQIPGIHSPGPDTGMPSHPMYSRIYLDSDDDQASRGQLGYRCPIMQDPLSPGFNGTGRGDYEFEWRFIDAAEMAEVVANTRSFDAVHPYEKLVVAPPLTIDPVLGKMSYEIGGVAYDASTRRIFAVLGNFDAYPGGGSYPVIGVWEHADPATLTAGTGAVAPDTHRPNYLIGY